MRDPRPRRSSFPARLALAGALAFGASGCATITGTVTGAFTGLIDGPAEVARHNEEAFRDHPDFWILDVLVVAPLACAVGPLAGLIKGIAIDVQWIRDEMDYGTAFGTYQAPSVWRPWTLHYEHGGSAMATAEKLVKAEEER